MSHLRNHLLTVRMEGGGERIYKFTTGGKVAYRVEYSFMQIEDGEDFWETGERAVASFEAYWLEFTQNPHWFAWIPSQIAVEVVPCIVKSLNSIDSRNLDDFDKERIQRWYRTLEETNGPVINNEDACRE